MSPPNRRDLPSEPALDQLADLGHDVPPVTSGVEAAHALAGYLSATLDVPAVGTVDAHGVGVIEVARTGWARVAGQVHDVLGLTFLDWLSAVDAPDGDPAGVDVVLHVAAVPTRVPGGPTSGTAPDGVPMVRRLLLRTRVPEVDLRLDSLTGVWPGVAWHERETHEMFGVGFDGFDDGSGLGLRPLLLPDGFEGTPLRKSFVLASRAVKPWPGAKEPGESGSGAPSRRTMQPPGVPDSTWGPREPEGTR